MTEPIVFERIIDVAVDEAFALFTEPARLRRWQAASAAIDLRVGGDFRFTVVPDSIAYGTFTEIDPGKRLVYTWGWKGEDSPPPDESTISVEFEPLGNQTRVTMTHAGLDEESAANHTVGWDHFFDRLQLAADTGDAGLNAWGLEDEFDLLKSAEASWAVCSDIMAKLNPGDATKQTPCADYTVHDLVEHLHGSLEGIGGMANADIPDAKVDSAESYIGQAVERVLAAWRKRGTKGTVPFGEGEAPASMMAGVLSLEFLLHAWDFAQAADLELQVPDALVTYVHGLAESTIQPEFRGPDKGFAEATTPATDDPMTKLAAFTGRTT